MSFFSIRLVNNSIIIIIILTKIIIIGILKECLVLIKFSQELLEEVYRILNDFLQTRF